MKAKSTVGNRSRHLEQRRREKMARSAHAYVRGNTLKFYEWLDSTKSANVPSGPPVWICGDCHVGNLGPVANADGKVEIEIRDLDQAVIGNPAHDLIRLGLSLATAARGSDLPGVTTAQMLEQIMLGYEEGLVNPQKKQKPSAKDAEPVQRILDRATKRKWHHLATEGIEDVEQKIALGKRFWALGSKERAEIHRLFRSEEARSLITCFKNRNAEDEICVLDAAYWVKGCSSLGRLRYAVLLGVGKRHYDDGGFCLVDIKEAVKAAAPRATGARMPRDNAQRVVEGARNLSPFLGTRMLPAELLGRPVVLRELMPADLKLEIDRLTREEATSAARFLAAVVGKAHSRQMTQQQLTKWRSDLRQDRTKKLDAPSWLWSSVVDLIAAHEIEYLEHCRRFAFT
jgi:uncharacterized protein (DUF2252 family)